MSFTKAISKGMSIAITYGSSLSIIAKKELAKAIDEALVAQKKKSEDRGFRKGSLQDRKIW